MKRFVLALLFALAGCTGTPASDLPAAVEAAAQSVVTLEIQQERSGRKFTRAFCSGVVISLGVVTTNAHCAKAFEHGPVFARFKDGTMVPATLHGTSIYQDSAVLHVDPAATKHFAKVRLTPLRAGEVVYTIGTPVGFYWNIAVGIVGQAGAILDESLMDPENAFWLGPWIISTAASNPGNSGGALVDADGFLVGVPTRTAGTLGMAIPIGEFLASLKAYL